MPCAHPIALYIRAAEVVEAGCLAAHLVLRAGIEPCRLWHDSHGITEPRKHSSTGSSDIQREFHTCKRRWERRWGAMLNLSDPVATLLVRRRGTQN
jgi:hypothetical protein